MSIICLDRSIDYTVFKGKSWQEKMNNCNECKCCDHHILNKPRYVLPTVREIDYIDVLDTTKELWYKECRCKCRYLARRMCEEANSDIMRASPEPSVLPMPPKKWLKRTPLYDLSLLDWATEQAIEAHWTNQVKACQYAIFHIC